MLFAAAAAAAAAVDSEVEEFHGLLLALQVCC
jgi:hypothetical protein